MENQDNSLDYLFQPHIGWIPTVLGNLSFKLVGHSGYPFDFYSIVYEDKKSKKLNIVCLQRRIPHDYAIPIPFVSERIKLCSHAWLGYYLKKENIESFFIFKCEGAVDSNTHTVQKIEGTVYRVFDRNYEEQRKLFKKFTQKINSINNHINTSGLDSTVDSNITNLIDDTTKNYSISCDIAIDRQGVCQIKNLGFNGSQDKEMLSEDVDIKREQLNGLISSSAKII